MEKIESFRKLPYQWAYGTIDPRSNFRSEPLVDPLGRKGKGGVGYGESQVKNTKISPKYKIQTHNNKNVKENPRIG